MDVPPVIREAFERGATLSISVSGGKDSQAMLALLLGLTVAHREIVHADLGRAEWPQTPGHVQQLSRDSGLPLVVVRRAKGDLVQRIEERLNSVSTVDPTRPAKPFWPSAQQRYCTSDLKRDPIHKHQRSHGRGNLIVSAIGMRAEESSARAKRAIVSVDRRITCKELRSLEPAEALKRWNGTGRLVLNWLPLHLWGVADVWPQIGTSVADLARRQELYRAGQAAEALEGWPAHPAYVFGNKRLSCALCVLAEISDLCNGRRHHPELYRHYVGLEDRSGYTFRDGFSLKDLPPESQRTIIT